jgi:hypothetical protein
MYKLCMLMHAVHYGRAPAYLVDIATPVSSIPVHANLRSGTNEQYDVVRLMTSEPSRAFSSVIVLLLLLLQ